MQKLADISVFENLQAEANRCIGAQSNVSVFSEPITKFPEGIEEIGKRIDAMEKAAPQLLAAARQFAQEHEDV